MFVRSYSSTIDMSLDIYHELKNTFDNIINDLQKTNDYNFDHEVNIVRI